MNFAFNEEQEELRAMARAFLADHSSSEQVRAAMQSDLGYDAEVWKRIGAELGWPALLVPEEYGGLGLGWIELVALLFNIMFFAIIIQVILSWIAPGGHHPLSSLLFSLTQPVMRPIQRYVPPIAGLDLSPLVALIGLQVIKLLLLPPLLALL